MKSPLIVLIEMVSGLISRIFESSSFIILKIFELLSSLMFITRYGILGVILVLMVVFLVIFLALKFLFKSSRTLLILLIVFIILIMIFAFSLSIAPPTPTNSTA